MAAGQPGSLGACQNETAPAVPLRLSAVSQPTDELLVRECLQDEFRISTFPDACLMLSASTAVPELLC